MMRPDSSRLPSPTFAAGDHRWTIGVQRVDVADFFSPTTAHREVLAERARWLADDAERYAILPPDAEAMLHETFELLAMKFESESPRERLLELGRRCEHDLVWLRRSEQAWNVLGGVVCFPSEWALAEKIGLPLAEVHAPVPKLNDELGPRIDAFLAGFDARGGWARFNWSLAADAQRNHHPHRRLPKIDAATLPENVFIRWEHQLLVRLPKSDAMLFAIGIELVAVADLKRDREAAGRLAHLLRTMSADVASYKHLTTSRERLIAYLEA